MNGQKKLLSKHPFVKIRLDLEFKSKNLQLSKRNYLFSFILYFYIELKGSYNQKFNMKSWQSLIKKYDFLTKHFNSQMWFVWSLDHFNEKINYFWTIQRPNILQMICRKYQRSLFFLVGLAYGFICLLELLRYWKAISRTNSHEDATIGKTFEEYKYRIIS